MEIILSIAAIILSIVSLSYSIYLSTQQTRLKTTTLRTELLSKVVDLKIINEHNIHAVDKIIFAIKKDKIDLYDENKLKTFLDQKENFNEFLKKTEYIYESISDPKHGNAISLEEIRHHIEALNKEGKKAKEQFEEYLAAIEELGPLIKTLSDEKMKLENKESGNT